ncbi:uncharacterized protein BDW70DRAFT_158050 [Aspergillus foveolatus]|uniref:uncharacterized protein n=1 Tax=Aspergillus foveolatus TaxID=210207 RepID=UPI003CCDFA84
MDMDDFEWESQGCYAEPFSAQRVVEAEQCEKAYGKDLGNPTNATRASILSLPRARIKVDRARKKGKTGKTEEQSYQCSVKEPPIYTAADEVSGHVILTTATQVDISAVSIWLSGVSTSRLHSLRVVETHQIVDIREQLFPPTACASSYTSGFATVSAGTHLFAFSLRLPQATQCSMNAGTFPASWQQDSTSTGGKTHLSRKLPPSTGATSSLEEIKYVLEASVRRDGIIRGFKKATRDLCIYPVPTLASPLNNSQASQTETQRIACRPSAGPKRLWAPAAYEITAKLLNGPFLVLGRPIPLAVELTSLDSSTDTAPCSRCSVSIPVSLHDFQTMLIETTEVRARGIEESQTQFRIVQTMANLRHPLRSRCDVASNSVNGDAAPVFRFRVDGTLWSRYPIPLSLTPSFETCNISRSYKLEVRLGIGSGGNNVRIVEFQFPVHLVPAASMRLGLEPGLEAPAGIEVPAPDNYEKQAAAKELELGM